MLAPQSLILVPLYAFSLPPHCLPLPFHLMCLTGSVLPAACLIGAGYTTSESAAIALISLSAGISGFQMIGSGINHIDLAPQYADVLMGFSNTWGSLGGVVAPYLAAALTVSNSKICIHMGWSILLVFLFLLLKNWPIMEIGEKRSNLSWLPNLRKSFGCWLLCEQAKTSRTIPGVVMQLMWTIRHRLEWDDQRKTDWNGTDVFCGWGTTSQWLQRMLFLWWKSESDQWGHCLFCSYATFTCRGF